MKLLLLLTTLSLPVLALDITTLDGRSFVGCKVTGVDSNGVSVVHRYGSDKIPWKSLSEEDRNGLGFWDTPAGAVERARLEAAAKRSASLASNRPPLVVSATPDPAAVKELSAFKVARGAAKKELARVQRSFGRSYRNAGSGSSVPELSIPDTPQGVRTTKTQTGDFVFVFPVSGSSGMSITVEIADIDGVFSVDSVKSN